MAQFHFVEDYENHVRQLKASHPLDEAMSLAVGGQYEEVGGIISKILLHFGLKSGMTVVDLGCGSGRVAKKISETLNVRYFGFDIVQDLIDYAASVSPPEYVFSLNRQLSIPLEDGIADFAFATSVFTHLLHEETYIYLKDFHRVLRSGGALAFSFLEFAEPSHWGVFEHTVGERLAGRNVHLNTFIERSQIAAWCEKLGYHAETYLSGHEASPNNKPLGQSMVLLRKI